MRRIEGITPVPYYEVWVVGKPTTLQAVGCAQTILQREFDVLLSPPERESLIRRVALQLNNTVEVEGFTESGDK